MKIVSVVVNNPELIELQYKTIKKFCKIGEEYEYIIFNDAKNWKDITNLGDINMREKISRKCEELKIRCIEIENRHHQNYPYINDPSRRHANSLNYITKYMINNPDIYFILDSDMFFIDYMNLDELKKYYFCYINQYRIINGEKKNYPWGNFFYININEVPNKDLINWDVDNGLDTGGKCHKWLELLDKEKVYEFKILVSSSWSKKDIPETINKKITNFLDNDKRNKDGKYFTELFENKILHYRGGSNWIRETITIQESMIKLMSIIIEEIMNN